MKSNIRHGIRNSKKSCTFRQKSCTFRQKLRNIRQMLRNVRQMLRNVRQMLRNVRQMLRNVRQLLRNVRQLLRNILPKNSIFAGLKTSFDYVEPRFHLILITKQPQPRITPHANLLGNIFSFPLLSKTIQPKVDERLIISFYCCLAAEIRRVVPQRFVDEILY
jgi:ABC-type transporter Mla subunit MlaD